MFNSIFSATAVGGYGGNVSVAGFQSLPRQGMVNESVRLVTGAISRGITIVNTPTLGSGFEFRLSHNSQGPKELGVLGRGWQHNYQAKLIVNTTLVTLVTDVGQHIDFISDGAGGWKVDLSTSVFVSHILSNPSGTVWNVTSPADGTVWTFEASAISGYPDSAGRLVNVTDRSGNSVTLSYDSSGQLITVQEPQGRQIQFTHSAGKLTEVTGPDNQTHLLTYDVFSNLQSVSGPEGCTVSFGYDLPGTGIISAITDARGNTTRYSCTDGLLYQIFYPNGSIMTYRYFWGSDGPWENLGRHGVGSNHNTTQVIHPGGEIYEYRFDKAGNLWRVISPSGHIKRFFWNNKAKLLYSSEGWPLLGENGQHGPYDNIANRYIGNTVDARGNTIGTLDPTGIFSTFVYDDDNRLVEQHPERGHFGVQGNWPDTYGKDGILLCAFESNGDDIYRPPGYLDSDPNIAITNGDGSGSNEFVRSNANTTRVIDPRAPIKGEGSLISGVGFWKHNGVDAPNSVFEFSLNLNQTKVFNLSLYSHSADLGLDILRPMTYYGEFGRDIEFEVQDLSGTQKVRIHNNAPGVWLTFPVSGDISNPIRVIVRATGSNTRPVISAIAFDEYHDRRTRYEYTNGNLVKVINRLKDEIVYTYNLDGTLATQTDVRGKTTTFDYLDSRKNLTRITDHDSNTTQFEYDDNANLRKVTDGNSHETVMTYDGKNRLLTRTDPLARTITWDYDGNGNVISIVDPLLNETTFGYTETNQLAYVEDALGHKIRFAYDANGRISKIIDARGFTTQYEYDQDGNQSQVEQPDGQLVSMAYDALNQLVALTGPNGNQKSLELANLIGGASLFRNPSLEEPDPNWPEGAKHWAWSDGTKVRSTQVEETGAASLPLPRDGKTALQRDLPLPEGAKFVTQLSFKAAPRTMSVRAKVRDASGLASDRENSMLLTDEQNSWWKWRAMAFQVPGDAQTSFSNPTVEEFDIRIEQPENAAGWVDTMELIMLSQAYRYDKAGRLKSVTSPDGSRNLLHRDLYGRVISSEDSVGRHTVFSYDVMDRLVAVTKPTGETLTFQYDAAGALLQFVDGESRTTGFAYDNLGRLSSITYPDTSTELFSYDAVGNLISYTDSGHQTKTFVYDDADRLITLTYPNSDTVEFTYDDADNLLSQTERNGDLLEFVYDDAYRVVQVTRTAKTGNTTPSWELHYTYDPNGNLLSCSDGVNELWSIKEHQDRYGTARYGSARYRGTYDGMNRPPGYRADGAIRTEFAYDHEGRRTDIDYANGVTSHVDYDILGRPLTMTTNKEVELLKTRYQYDLNSQRTSQLTGNDTLDYTLDDDGKLVGEAVNRLVLKGFENLGYGNLASLKLAGDELSLLPLDDDFSGSELNSDRWRIGYYATSNSGYVITDPWDDLGSEIRQGDGLHFTFPRGYCDRTAARDILHPANDALGTLDRQHLFFVEHRHKLVGDFDVQVRLADSQYYGSTARPALYVSDKPLDTVGTLTGIALGRLGANLMALHLRGGSRGSSPPAQTSGVVGIRRTGDLLEAYFVTAAGPEYTHTGWKITLPSSVESLHVGLYTDMWYSASMSVTFQDFIFNTLTADTYADAGSYLSPVYDAGRNVEWDNLSWLGGTPTGTQIKLQVATSDTADGPWDFRGPDGLPNSYFIDPTPTSVGNSVISRYCRIKAYLSGDGSATPTLGGIDLSFSGDLPSQHRAYAYDEAGNMVERFVHDDTSAVVETRTYDAMNQLVSNAIDDGIGTITWTLTYDDNGNLTSKSDGTDTWDYAWSEDNYLISVSLNSSLVVSYVYDSSSRLLQRVEGGTTTNYHWDGWDLVREEKSGTVTETTDYLCPQGEVLAFKRGGDWYYLHGDALSSTQLVTDENGAVVGRYVYGAWGDELSASESIPGLFENRFVGGLGCRRDSATGLVYMRHRWYDPQLQRFISRDPIGLVGGWNLYQYCENRPTNFVDPLGLAYTEAQCKRLAQKIQNLRNSINKRINDLNRNPLNLPFQKPCGDLRDDMLGHMLILAEEYMFLNSAVVSYFINCSGRPPLPPPIFEPFPVLTPRYVPGDPTAPKSPPGMPAPPWRAPTPVLEPVGPPPRPTLPPITSDDVVITTTAVGAGTILYWVISEGSRLFPPRNAIPIP